jgi:nucleoside-diphosphate-sugar epimerase
MIYVDDVVDCLLLLGEKEACLNEVYGIGSLESITFLELVQAIVRACGSGRYVHAPWPEERKTIEVGDVVTDFAKLTRHTGWKPATRLAEGLEKTAAFYRQNREHYW